MLINITIEIMMSMIKNILIIHHAGDTFDNIGDVTGEQ